MIEAAYRVDDGTGAEADDPAVQIPRLEAEIERLARVAESCRKVILVAKVAIVLGALVLLVTIAGVIRVNQLVALGAIAAILGGIAAAGSNSRTLREATANTRAAEARRAELIAALPFSAVIEEGKR
jgi:TRAP-type mannitol/chloroaromatic compound transport system permease large subunit